jgi:hypothetical protein
VDEYREFRYLNPLENRIPLTHTAPGLCGFWSLGEGIFGFSCYCAPVLANPELADTLLEAVAEALVLVGPESTGAAYL